MHAQTVPTSHTPSSRSVGRLFDRIGVTRVLALLITLASFAYLPGCDRSTPSAPGAPTTSRVVPFSPGLALLMRDMGLGDRIVGRHAYDLATPGTIPPVGDEGGVDQEAILRAKPDLVFIQRSAQGPPPFLSRCNDQGRFALAVIPLLSLDDIPNAVRAIDRRVAAIERRPPSIDDPDSVPAKLVRQMELAFAPHPERYQRAGRVLLLASANPPAAFGPGSWHHDLLLRVGGTPAITQGGPYIALDTEDLLRLAPEAIILIEAQSPDATPVLKRLGSLATLDVPAIKNARAIAIDDPYIMTPSAAMIDLADRLDHLLAEWSQTR